MIDWGSVPQWSTALIAAGALYVGSKSIQSQREIARKWAAMDFFTKTEMDRNTLDAHTKFTEATKQLKATLSGTQVSKAPRNIGIFEIT